ncbi:hypothetical protein [Sphingomonas gellani]|uniref:hypothetical protein n=1 Tax=Sphingomonas gellani TaxID=1166340 RepID=UPI000B85AA58|nr:hypothetical protein [Sphingomonas gellani]
MDRSSFFSAGRCAVATTLLLLAGCSGGGSVFSGEKDDRRLADPAVAAAINAPILTDPGLQQWANADTIRPPTMPDLLSVPPDELGATRPDRLPAAAPTRGGGCPECDAASDALTLTALAARQTDARISACAAGLRYATEWANELPASLLPPVARVTEAAGNDDASCHLRAVTLAASASPDRAVDAMFAAMIAGGYAPEHWRGGTAHLLRGRRGDATLTAYVTGDDDGGSDIRLLFTQAPVVHAGLNAGPCPQGHCR